MAANRSASVPVVPFLLLLILLSPAPPAGAGDGGDDPAIRGIASQIRALEYRFSSDGEDVWTAPNRTQELRTRISPEGVEVVSRRHGADPADGGFRLLLQLTRFGREGSLLPVAAAAPIGAPDRIEIHRGPITEWYRNDPRGLEQGFTILNIPGHGNQDGPVVLELRLSGGMTGVLSRDRRAVLLRDAGGAPILRYSELLVFDSRGRTLPSGLGIGPGRIEIRFDDGDAAYPITVDPIITAAVWSGESNQEGSQFGMQVATAGDVNGDGFSDLIIGAPSFDVGFPDMGRAFVYHGSPGGVELNSSWTGEGDLQIFQRFGSSVASAGDVNGDGFHDVIVGSPFFDLGGLVNPGKAYLYLGSPAGLGTVPAWTFTGTQEGSQFGFAVAHAGDVNNDGFHDVIVGANLYDDTLNAEGRAYLFLGSAAGLAAAPAWTADGNLVSAQFGSALGPAGDTNGDGFDDVIIGAPHFNGGELEEGKAFVFFGASFGLQETPAWTAEGDQNNALFGNSVSTAGDVNGDGFADIIIGAPYLTTNLSREGAAFVYHGGFNGPDTTASWRGTVAQSGAAFGFSVSTAGDTNGDGIADVVVGAESFDLTAGGNQGSAFFYLGSSSGVKNVADASVGIPDEVDASFGRSVAAAGDVNGDGFADAIVGAPRFDNGETDEGRAFVYLGSAGGLSTLSHLTVESGQGAAQLGFTVASAGDVNGDGFGDVIVGAPFFDAGEVDEGMVFVYGGAATGLSISNVWVAEGNQAGAEFGYTVSSGGDMNGDGFGDILVGAPSYDFDRPDEGGVFAWFGGTTGLGADGTPANADWTAAGNQSGSRFGQTAVSAGDVNADGIHDVAIGAPLFDQEVVDGGKVVLYLGGPAGPGPSPTWDFRSDQADAQVGYSVAPAGDVNGDGFSDLIIGAPFYDTDLRDEGRAYLFNGGGARGLVDIPTWILTTSRFDSMIGWTVAPAGDVNGDGFADVILGFPNFTQFGLEPEGRIYLFLGSPAGLPATRDWTLALPVDGAFFGHSVTGAGDVNGDGFSDLIVGAPFYTNGQTEEGAAFLYLGSPTLPSSMEAWSSESNHPGARWGFSVAPAGDVNGDGFSDVILGSPHFGFLDLQAGRFTTYLGNDGDGLDRSALQVRVTTADPIHTLGKSDQEDSFRIRTTGRSPAGRARIGIEWEVKPLGGVFDESGLTGSSTLLQTGPVSVLGGSSVQLEEVAGGLTSANHYHWRLRYFSRSPFFPRSPWKTIPQAAANLTDLRTAGCGDADGDGFGAPPDPACTASTVLADCDDGNPLVSPAGEETCDGIDNTCDGRVDISSGSPPLMVDEFLISWLPLATSASFDLVRGDLIQLHATGGDYAASLIQCILNDTPDTSVNDFLQPNPGEGFWFVVRSVDCGGNGTYDSGSPAQVKSRDLGINSAALTCP